MNRLIDYKIFSKDKERIKKLFVENNNPLSLYKDVVEDGYLTILDSTSSIYKINVKDFKDNDVLITIPIKGKLKKDLEAIFRKNYTLLCYS